MRNTIFFSDNLYREKSHVRTASTSETIDATKKGGKKKKQVIDVGDGYEIFNMVTFQPRDATIIHSPTLHFMGPPEHIIQRLKQRYDRLDTITQNIPGMDTSSLDRARVAYLEMFKSVSTGSVFLDAEVSIHPQLKVPRAKAAGPLDLKKRMSGNDWTYLGDTMTGWKRMNNVHALVKDVIQHNIPGDYIETGVWRGGSSMFARAVILAYENYQEQSPSSSSSSPRKSFVCDSFRGLPPGARGIHAGDRGWDNTPYLEVHEDIVVDGFDKYSLLDEDVIFVKGFFNDTMPRMRPRVETFPSCDWTGTCTRAPWMYCIICMISSVWEDTLLWMIGLVFHPRLHVKISFKYTTSTPLLCQSTILLPIGKKPSKWRFTVVDTISCTLF